MKYTIQDVAREAGVSIGTVSRIVNNVAGFTYAPATKAKVLQIIRRRGYVPSTAAQLMRTRKSRIIGLAVQSENSQAAAITLDGCSQEAKAQGYAPVMLDVYTPNLTSVLNMVGRMDLLGGAICNYPGQERILARANPALPIVTLKGKVTHAANVREVSSDYHVGVRQALEHLQVLGHRRIAHLACDDNIEERQGNNARFAFIDETARVLGLDPVRIDQRRAKDGSGFEAAMSALPRFAAEPAITAALCRNDELAMALIAGLVKRGIRVPQDFSVIGYDDLPYAAYTTPALTTIRQDFKGLARTAVRLLIACIDARETQLDMLPTCLKVETRLVVRDSTAKKRGAR